jgi:hypothetical protein
MLSGQRKPGSSPVDDGPNARANTTDVDSEDPVSTGRPQRSTRAARPNGNGWRKGDDHIEDYNSVDEMDDEEDAASSGDNWDGDDDEKENFAADDEDEDDADEEMSQSDDEGREDDANKHLVVQLRYRKGESKSSSAAASRKNSGQGTTSLPVTDSKTHQPMAIPMETSSTYISPTRAPPQFNPKSPIVEHAHPTPELPNGSYHPVFTNGPSAFNQSLNSHPVIKEQTPESNFGQSQPPPHSPTLPIHPPQPQSAYLHHPNGISQPR